MTTETRDSVNAAGARPLISSRAIAGLALAIGALWLLLRILFFEGIWGSDDYFYMRFATLWNPPPQMHLEARLFFNWVIRQSHALFGGSEVSWVLPCLFSSAVTLCAAMFLGFRYAGARGMVVAGLVISTVPLDLTWATTVTASSFASGITAVATVLLFAFAGPATLIAAGISAAMAILAHSTTVFYFLALAAAHWLFTRNRRAVYFLALAIPLFVMSNTAINTAVNGDALHEFRILRNWHDPEPKMPLYSLSWFMYPLTRFFCSKDLVFLPVLCIAGVLFTPALRKRREARILAAAVIFTWLWFGYGTARPTDYEPFWREVRFNQPAMLAMAVLAGMFAGQQTRFRTAVLMASVCSVNVLVVAGSGSWGQRDDIAREFLPFVKAHPEALFLTDGLTRRDLEMWNGFVPLENVQALNGITAADVKAARKETVFVIENPLRGTAEPYNSTKQSAKAPSITLGDPVHRSRQVLRPIAYVLPSRLTSASPFFIRRPSGALRPVLRIAPPDVGSAGAALAKNGCIARPVANTFRMDCD